MSFEKTLDELLDAKLSDYLCCLKGRKYYNMDSQGTVKYKSLAAQVCKYLNSQRFPFPADFNVIEVKEKKYGDRRFTLRLDLYECSAPALKEECTIYGFRDIETTTSAIAYVKLDVNDIEIEPKIANGNTKGYLISRVSVYALGKDGELHEADNATFGDLLNNYKNGLKEQLMAQYFVEKASNAVSSVMNGRLVCNAGFAVNNALSVEQYADTLKECIDKLEQTAAELCKILDESKEIDASKEREESTAKNPKKKSTEIER